MTPVARSVFRAEPIGPPTPGLDGELALSTGTRAPSFEGSCDWWAGSARPQGIDARKGIAVGHLRPATGAERRGPRAGRVDMDIPPFDLITSRTDDAAVVTIVGELDLSTAPRLLEVLAELAGNGTNDVTLDLAEMAFIDSTGVSVLSQV